MNIVCSEKSDNTISHDLKIYWVKLFFVFLVSCLLLFGSMFLINTFDKPAKLIYVVFIPCLIIFTIQMSQISNIKCPACGQPVFVKHSIGKFPLFVYPFGLFGTRCPHCNCENKS